MEERRSEEHDGRGGNPGLMSLPELLLGAVIAGGCAATFVLLLCR